MNFQWILLAIFISAIVLGIAKAITRPMLKNVLRFLCVPVAFIFTYILLVLGVFQSIIARIVAFLDLAAVLPGFDEVIDFAVALVSTWLTPLMFTGVFMILIFLFRTVHVNLIYLYVTRRKIRREKAELKARIKFEKAMAKAEVRENEKRIREYIELNADKGVEDIIYDVYETPDKDDIEDMVEERVEKEYKAKKKRGIFKESPEHKSISIVSGAVSAFLILAVFLMPTFHLMSNMGAITEAIKTTDADDTKIYHAIEVFDKHIVTPYEESFVFELYDSMGLVDLMNDMVRRGGKIINDDGSVTYIDTMSKNMTTSSVRLALEMTSGKSEHKNVANDITTLTSEPVIVSMMASSMVVLMQNIENPEPAEGDMVGAMIYNIIDAYKTADKQLFIDDMSAITETLVVIVEKNIITGLLTGTFDPASLLEEPEILGDLLGAASGLSVFPVTLDGTFGMVIDMIAPMLGAPANDAAGYDSIMNSMISATGTMSTMTDEDLANFIALMEGASKFDNLYDYICDPVERPGGLRDLKENGDRLKERGEELKLEAEALKQRGEALAEDAKVLEAKGKALEAEGKALEAEAEALKNEAAQVEQEFENFKNNPPLDLSPEEIEAKIKEFEDKIADLEKRGEELKAEADELTLKGEDLKKEAEDLEADAKALESEGKKLQEQGEKLADDAENLMEILDDLTAEIQDKMTLFTPFISYYMNWNYMQKPFMISSEDTSTACLSIKVGDIVYVCNTDTITLMDIMDAMQDGGTTIDTDFGFTEDDITNADISIDDMLAKIPMKDLLKKISVDTDLTDYEGRISPVADLINHFINSFIVDKNNGSFSATNEWINQTLVSFDDGTNDSASSVLVAKLLAVNSDATKAEFDYLGITAVDWHNATHFSPEEWTKEHRKEDSKKLVEIIFTMMDMMKSLGGSDMLPINAVEGEGSDLGSDGAGENPFASYLDLFIVLGKTMDIMAETHCLGDLPPVMIETLLKNQMLSMAMTPAMLNDFMSKLEPEREDFSYEVYLQELVDTFSELLNNIPGGAIQ